MDASVSIDRKAIGISDVPGALLARRSVFERVEDVAVWGWPLVVLLTVVTVIGYTTVQTGLIDHEIDGRVQERIARIESEQRDVVERSELRKMYEREIKAGEFEAVLARIGFVVAEPIKVLASALGIAAILYGLVALTGKKTEWHTLLVICVLASYTDAARLLAKLGLMMHYRAMDVETSLAVIGRFPGFMEEMSSRLVAGVGAALSAFDPFRMWFWLLVIVGISTTGQLSRRRAIAAGIVCWLLAGLVRAGIAASMAGVGPA